MSIIGVVESLHWFYQPCEKEVFEVINKSNTNDPGNVLPAVTNTITTIINELQSALQATITNLLQSQNDIVVSQIDDNMETATKPDARADMAPSWISEIISDSLAHR